MIHVQCPHCGAKLRVPEQLAGKEGRCPRCKGKLTVPQAAEPSEEQELRLVLPDPAEPRVEPVLARRRENSDFLAKSPAPEPEARASLGMTAPDYSGQRRLPWPIDILLYPANLPGFVTLFIVAGLPYLFNLAAALLCVFALPLAIGNIVIGLYCYWYLAECVDDSAHGGTRAPMTLDVNTGLGEMFSRVVYLAAVYILFLGPAGFYYMFTQRADGYFWGLAAWAILFFPMGLLAMVLHDSTSALNPLFLLGSILRTLLPYIGLVLLTGIVVGIVVGMRRFAGRRMASGSDPGWLVAIVWSFVSMYAAMVFAHVLGRFYWCYRGHLDWGL